MKKRTSPIILIGLVFVFSFFPGCGGTGTGNPGVLTSSAPTTNTGRILSEVCSLLNQCVSGISNSECRSGVTIETNLEAPLGLTPGTYVNFLAIMTADGLGSIQSNPAATSTCVSELTNLSCFDTYVQSAKDVFGGYSGVAPLLTTRAPSCAGVF
jgi:hypothetical protein